MRFSTNVSAQLHDARFKRNPSVDEGIPDGYYRSELADARYCGMSTESTYILWGIYIVSAFVTTKICSWSIEKQAVLFYTRDVFDRF